MDSTGLQKSVLYASRPIHSHQLSDLQIIRKIPHPLLGMTASASPKNSCGSDGLARTMFKLNQLNLEFAGGAVHQSGLTCDTMQAEKIGRDNCI